MNNALVPLTCCDQDNRKPSAASRSNAGFIAHLIATAEQVPQMRSRRRAEPKEAIATYRALGQWPTTPGRELSRSL